MNLLVNACETLEQELEQALDWCQAMQSELNEFANNVSNGPILIVKARLRLIIRSILAHAASLYSHNNGKGFVYVMVTPDALGVCWEQKEYSQSHKDSFKAHGTIILSPTEAVSMVEEKMSRLDSRNWVDVVKWINDCGSYVIALR